MIKLYAIAEFDEILPMLRRGKELGKRTSIYTVD